MTFNDDVREEFDRNGFIVVRKGISEHAISEMRSALETIFAEYTLDGENLFEAIIRLGTAEKPTLYRIYQFIARSFVAMDLPRQDCMRLAKHLLPTGSTIDIGSAVIFGLPRNNRLTWDWHQESPYDSEIPNAIHFCYPIFERADTRNGTMSVLKGSHKLGTLPYRNVKLSEDSATSLVPVGIENFEKEFEEVHFVADPGDLIVFHNDLIHRSNENLSERPRVTGLCRLAAINRVPRVASWIDGKAY